MHILNEWLMVFVTNESYVRDSCLTAVTQLCGRNRILLAQPTYHVNGYALAVSLPNCVGMPKSAHRRLFCMSYDSQFDDE